MFLHLHMQVFKFCFSPLLLIFCRAAKVKWKKRSASFCFDENELHITINHRTILTKRLNVAEEPTFKLCNVGKSFTYIDTYILLKASTLVCIEQIFIADRKIKRPINSHSNNNNSEVEIVPREICSFY